MGSGWLVGKFRWPAIDRKDDIAMPRYYFNLSDGKQLLNNHKGVDLSGNAAAREDALVLARDLTHGAVMPGWDWDGWFVMIVDAHGHKVDEVPIAVV
jgi:hypothetical protein